MKKGLHPPTKGKSFPPNPWGLYDMHGNIDEVCVDVYDPYFNAYSEIKDPVNLNPEGATRTIRGGDFSSPPVWCMCAYRNYYEGMTSSNSYLSGFRLVAEKVAAKQ